MSDLSFLYVNRFERSQESRSHKILFVNLSASLVTRSVLQVLELFKGFSIDGFRSRDYFQSDWLFSVTNLIRYPASIFSSVFSDRLKNIQANVTKILEVLPTWAYKQLSAIEEPLDLEIGIIDRFNPGFKVSRFSLTNPLVFERSQESRCLKFVVIVFSLCSSVSFKIINLLQTVRINGVHSQSRARDDLQCHRLFSISFTVDDSANISSSVFFNTLQDIQRNEPKVLEVLPSWAYS